MTLSRRYAVFVDLVAPSGLSLSLMRMGVRQAPLEHSVVIGVSKDSVQVLAAGIMTVDVTEVRRCRGAAVLVPGPIKDMQRCEDKIAGLFALPPNENLEVLS